MYSDYNLCISKPALFPNAKTESPGIIVYSPIEYITSWMSICIQAKKACKRVSICAGQNMHLAGYGASNCILIFRGIYAVFLREKFLNIKIKNKRNENITKGFQTEKLYYFLILS